VLRAKLPQRIPAAPLHCARLIASLWHLFRNTRLLSRRAAYHAGLFGAFSVFCSVVPAVLSGKRFQLSQSGVVVFALVVMAGDVASPIAGKVRTQRDYVANSLIPVYEHESALFQTYLGFAPGTAGSADPSKVAYRSVWRDKLADFGDSFSSGAQDD